MEELVDEFVGQDEQHRQVEDTSGARYRVSVMAEWDYEEEPWGTDLYVWVRVRAERGWLRSWWGWRATLVGDSDTQEVIWAQEARKKAA